MVETVPPDNAAMTDALIVADDATGYPTDVLEARLKLLEHYPAIRRQLVDEIVRRKLQINKVR